MSDRNKPSIPAWQRAQPKPAPPPQDDPVYSQPESNPIETGESTKDDVPTSTDPIEHAASEDPESVPSDTTSPTTSPPAEAMSTKATAATGLNTSDFAQYQQTTAPRPSQQHPTAPPIITYPEFLISAHKPPPLITPTRIINTLYLASGISALLYGASKWLITPMVDSLSASRHDLLTHSTTKLEDFNARLSKIVTKLPESKKAPTDTDDVESISSDPTELYHRDMGTQTSPPIPSSPIPVQKSAVDHEVSVLQILQSHLAEMADSSEKVGDTHRERQLTFDKFRHFLDSKLYNMDGLPTWEAAADGSMERAKGTVKNDGIEELKREIRGVKGVLLSAKRFPTARPMPEAASAPAPAPAV